MGQSRVFQSTVNRLARLTPKTGNKDQTRGKALTGEVTSPEGPHDEASEPHETETGAEEDPPSESVRERGNRDDSDELDGVEHASADEGVGQAGGLRRSLWHSVSKGAVEDAGRLAWKK